MSVEQIILEVDAKGAMRGADQANRALEAVWRAADKGQTAIERNIRAFERQSALVGKSGLDRVAAAREITMRQLAGDPEAIERVNQAFNRMAEAHRKVEASSQTVGQALKGVGLHLAATVLSAHALTKVLEHATVQTAFVAARQNTLGVALEASARANDLSVRAIQQQEGAIARMGITTAEARQSLLRMITANLDFTQASRLARLAQDAAVIGNMNSSEAFEHMIYGLQSANVRVLRTIGINADFQESYERLARQLGKTTLELSDTEKAQARLNEVLLKAPRFAGIYEAAMTDVGKRMTSLKRYFEEAEVAVGQQFQPALRLVVDTLTDLLKLIEHHPEIGMALTVLATGGMVGLGARVLGMGKAGKLIAGAGAVAAAGAAGKGLVPYWSPRLVLPSEEYPHLAIKTEAGVKAWEAEQDLKRVGALSQQALVVGVEKRAQEAQAAVKSAAWQKYFDSLKTEEAVRQRITKAEAEAKAQAEALNISGYEAAMRRAGALKHELELIEKARQAREASIRAGEKLARELPIRVDEERRKQFQESLKETNERLLKQFEADEERTAGLRQREMDYQEDTGKLWQHAIEVRRQQEEQAVDASRQAQLRGLEMVHARTLEEKVTLEARKLEVELDYLRRSEEFQRRKIVREREEAIREAQVKAALLFETDEEYQRRVRAIRELAAERERLLEGETAARIAEQQDRTAIRQAEIVRSHNERVFEQIKDSAGRVFDALLTRSESFGKALANTLKTAILTPLREGVSTLVANMLAPLFGGRPLATAGGLGRLGGIFGMGAGAGFGIPGAQGGTGGFAGPAWPTGTTARPGAAWGANLAGFLPGIKDFLGIGGSIPTGPGMATTWQAATAGQKLSALGRSDAATLGGGMLLYAGLRRGGAAGVGMSAAGGALIGFKFGGPLGAAIGAGAGAAAGLVRLFIKGAEEKAREKIRAVYGIEMRDKGVLRQIVDTARQAFGGNLDVAIRSPQIRELIELYAMSTGQQAAGIVDRMRPVELLQSRGGIFEAPAYLSSTPLPALTRLPTAAPPPPSTTIINFTMPAEAVNEAFNGRTQQFIIQHPRAIQGAAHQAARSSYGRREAAAMLMSPGTILA